MAVLLHLTSPSQIDSQKPPELQKSSNRPLAVPKFQVAWILRWQGGLQRRERRRQREVPWRCRCSSCIGRTIRSKAGPNRTKDPLGAKEVKLCTPKKKVGHTGPDPQSLPDRELLRGGDVSASRVQQGYNLAIPSRVRAAKLLKIPIGTACHHSSKSVHSYSIDSRPLPSSKYPPFI